MDQSKIDQQVKEAISLSEKAFDSKIIFQLMIGEEIVGERETEKEAKEWVDHSVKPMRTGEIWYRAIVVDALEGDLITEDNYEERNRFIKNIYRSWKNKLSIA